MKNSFTVQYAVHLTVAALGLTGIPASIFTFIAARVLGEMLDRGIVVVDIKIDKLKQALKDPQWKAAALKAYEAASKGNLTESEKNDIREQYKKALSNYATFGN